MVKKMSTSRKIISLVILCFAIVTSFNNLMTVKAADDNAPRRQINVVYDNSGSMYNSDDGTLVDTWCQAKYSMEVFAAMLGEYDSMNIYYMSDYRNDTSAPPRLVLDGKDGSETNVRKIHEATTTAGYTPFNSVIKAYSDLEKNDSDERWLIILTDGAFQGIDGTEGIDNFLSQKQSDINVMFLGMGADAEGITPKENEGIYYVEAKTNNQILNEITGICTRVFNSNRLDVNASSKTFSFDVPMAQLIVFAQGANVDIKGVLKEDGTLIRSSRNPVEVKYSECDASNHNNPPVTDLVGSIATFTDDFSSGDYSLDVSGAETIEIYYRPNIAVSAYLTDSNGNEVTDMKDLEAGEYTISFGFVKAGTQEKVNQSALLGNVEYEAIVTNNGVVHETPYSNGDQITLEEGTLSIDVVARYLEYNSVSSHLDYSIYQNKAVSFSVLQDPTFTVISDGIEGDNSIVVQATIDNQPMSKEQWEIMDIPSVMMVDENREFKIESPIIEKTDDVGLYRIKPSLPDGKPSSGTYTDCRYELYYEQKFGSETWSGETKGVFHFVDTRSWWERNYELFIKLAISLAFLFIVAGYMPFIKHYLPKSLKRKPYIRCIPSEPGEKRKDRNGSLDKSIASTIIPYIPQRGTIKYVPKGVTGAPPLLVRGIKGRRMTLTNVKAFAGKDYITFDGETIKKETKKFDTGGSVTIRVKRGEWTYVCNPNQEN